MDDFYAARSRTIPPLPWSNIAPPFLSMASAPCDTAFRNMFAARKEVFVDLLGWDVPVLEMLDPGSHLAARHHAT